MAYHYYFPKEWTDLQIELSYHPECIMAVMQVMDYVQANPFEHKLEMADPQTTFLVKLAAIAKYCGIALDSEYTAEEVNKICRMCSDWLKENRKEWRVDSHE